MYMILHVHYVSENYPTMYPHFSSKNIISYKLNWYLFVAICGS